MSIREEAMALDVPPLGREELDADMRDYLALCEDKLGFVPNVLTAHAFSSEKLRVFREFYDELMLADSGLSKLEREMIAVVVSSANHCLYCLVAHGAAVRKLSGDPLLGEVLVMNYREADIPARQRAMLDFAWKATASPQETGAEDRARLREAGFSERDIWDIANVTGFFNFSNRVAMAAGMTPNSEYHQMAREPAEDPPGGKHE